MRIHPMSRLLSGLWLTLILAATAVAQDTSLTRSEVAALKAKLVAVQQAMGGDPSGYLKESEDFNLPTDSNPAQGGKFWPITSGITLRYTDRASAEGVASAEKAAEDFQARYAEALASGNYDAMTKMAEEMTQLQAAAMTPAVKKEDMTVYVQFNMNPSVGIDPDAVVLEQSGVIALRRKEMTGDRGDVTVYLDPVALEATQELSKIELRTADDGVSNKTGVFHIVIQMNGAVTDIEAWVKSFDFPAMLAVMDSR
jgi:hypothetical protein